MDFFDLDGNKKMTLIFDREVVSQVILYLKDSNPEILDKKLIISNKHFKENEILSYRKCYNDEENQITEYYINELLDSKFITKHNLSKKTTLGLGADGKLFYEKIVKYNGVGNIISISSIVYNMDGSVTLEENYNDKI